jgi:hypothetical protein
VVLTHRCAPERDHKADILLEPLREGRPAVVVLVVVAVRREPVLVVHTERHRDQYIYLSNLSSEMQTPEEVGTWGNKTAGAGVERKQERIPAQGQSRWRSHLIYAIGQWGVVPCRRPHMRCARRHQQPGGSRGRTYPLRQGSQKISC